MRKQQSGFTLIELVIVIVILGLLAATALPRFADLTNDAQVAAFSGIRGGFRSAVAISHAQWLADGASSSASNNITLEGQIVTMNGSGWPRVTASQDATTVFNRLMNEPLSSLTNWSGSGAGGTATYVLGVGNNGAFTYAEANGAVTVTVQP